MANIRSAIQSLRILFQSFIKTCKLSPWA